MFIFVEESVEVSCPSKLRQCFVPIFSLYWTLEVFVNERECFDLSFDVEPDLKSMS